MGQKSDRQLCRRALCSRLVRADLRGDLALLAANPASRPSGSGCRRYGRLAGDHLAFGCHSPSAAPVGSMMIENEPAFGTSVTSRITVAPSDFALAVAAVTSSTSA